MNGSLPLIDLPMASRIGWLVRALFVSLGFATIDLIWLLKPAVESTQRLAFHWSGNSRGLFLAAALDVLLLTVIVMLLLWAGREPGKTRAAIWGGLLLFIPWILLIDYHILMHLIPIRKLSFLLFWGPVVAVSWFTARWKSAYSPRFEQVVAQAATVLTFVGIFGAMLLCSLAWFGWRASSLSDRYPLHHAQMITPPRHRIIWILFDELSYRQVYEHRFAGLELPAFDAFAAQATSFSKVIPIDTQTEIVMPGLMTGIPMDNIKTSSTAHFMMHNTRTRTWQPFDPRNTVFQDALNAGYSTGVVGWYNPYCRILASVLDRCFWVYRGPVSNGMSMSNTVIRNMLGPLNTLNGMLLSAGPAKVQYLLQNRRVPGSGLGDPGLHVEDFEDLYPPADKLIADPNAGFILLHMPIPHPTGIYDRKTGKLRPDGSYMDNLALADRTLAALRLTLEKVGAWDSSTIIVMGDHSWRTTQLWFHHRMVEGWTPDDNTASENGSYDERPAYLVKLPGQTVGSRVDTPFYSENTRLLFDGILSHKINSTADLASWAESVK